MAYQVSTQKVEARPVSTGAFVDAVLVGTSAHLVQPSLLRSRNTGKLAKRRSAPPRLFDMNDRSKSFSAECPWSCPLPRCSLR
jgi:hypothetical protein